MLNPKHISSIGHDTCLGNRTVVRGYFKFNLPIIIQHPWVSHSVLFCLRNLKVNTKKTHFRMILEFKSHIGKWNYQRLKIWKSNTLVNSKGNLLQSKGVFCLYCIETFLNHTFQFHCFCVTKFWMSKKCVRVLMVGSGVLALFEVGLQFSLWHGLRSTGLWTSQSIMTIVL